MRCSSCGAETASGFPGAKIRCTTCGAENVARASAGGPYRDPAQRPSEPASIASRKPRSQPPAGDAAGRPCPRCGAALGPALDHPGMFDCNACHGLFMDAATLARATEEAKEKGPGSFRPSAPPGLEPITYVKCPVCAEVMNRTNFGRRSGVIVDICKAHGTWFDAGELDGALAFVAKGGLEETAKRDQEEAKRRAREERVEKEANAIRNALSVQSTYEARHWRAQVTTGQALLDALDALVRLSD